MRVDSPVKGRTALRVDAACEQTEWDVSGATACSTARSGTCQVRQHTLSIQHGPEWDVRFLFVGVRQTVV